MDVEIREADLSNAAEADAITRLVDEYARLPIGGGVPLDEEVLRDMVPGLRRHPGALFFWLGSTGALWVSRFASPDFPPSRPGR